MCVNPDTPPEADAQREAEEHKEGTICHDTERKELVERRCLPFIV